MNRKVIFESSFHLVPQSMLCLTCYFTTFRTFFQDDPRLEEYNVEEKVEEIMEYIQRQVNEATSALFFFVSTNGKLGEKAKKLQQNSFFIANLFRQPATRTSTLCF